MRGGRQNRHNRPLPKVLRRKGVLHPLRRTRDGGEYSIFSGDGEIGYRGSKKTGIVARDLKSRKKEFLNRYTRRMWNLRVRYVIASKGRRVVK